MNFEEFIKSNTFKKTMKIVMALIILILVFAAGVFVGLEKARFSYRFGENYYNNFERGRHFLPTDQDFINAHGIAGQIIKITDNDITIKGAEGVEKNIIVSDQTTIRQGFQDIKINDLKIDENVIVIGSPSDKGEIEAKLIRLLPSPLLPPPPPGNSF